MAYLYSLGPLVAAAKPVDFTALDRSFFAGWLTLLVFLGVLGFLIAHAKTLRRFLLRVEDPRPLAIVRIGIGICVMGNILELWEHYEFLFMDQGLFPDEVARHVRARKQFAGFGEGIAAGEPTGFYDLKAFWTWLKGPNYSLLLLKSSPPFFWIHWAAFMITTTMLIVGYKTRWTKWISWFLFNSIIMRNALFWEGTENVYRTLFVYLCVSNCGAAYSVDNWLRRRKLRREGRLSEPGGPGDGAGLAPCDAHPRGLEPFYQAIPFWPRLVMMLQFCVMYLCTGVLKNGGVWMRGDAMYYALNLDHFYRMPPQVLSSWLGVNMFRINTHVTHYWESCFSLLFVGLAIRWVRSERPDSGLNTGHSRLAKISLALGYLAFWGLVLWLIPARYKPGKNGVPVLAVVSLTATGAVLITGIVFFALRQLLSNSRRLAAGDPTVTCLKLSRDSLRTWVSSLLAIFRRRSESNRPTPVLPLEAITNIFLGRTLWLGLGLIFHGHLILLMNIGWFSPIVLAAYAAFFNGQEIGRVIDRVTLPIGRKLGWTRRKTFIASPDPIISCRRYADNLQMPRRAMWAVLAAMVVAAFWHATTMIPFAPAVTKAIRSVDTKFTAPEQWTTSITAIHAGWTVLYCFTMLMAVAIRQAYGWRVRTWAYPFFVLLVAAMGALRTYDVMELGWGIPLTLVLIVSASVGAPAQECPPLPTHDAITGRPRVGWNAGPITRALTGILVCFHIIAIAIWVYPSGAAYDRFRAPAHQTVSAWVRTTQTTQGWSMFAPNPPRRNVFMQVIVTEKNGQSWDLQTDVYACFLPGATKETCDATYPTPWIWYSRTRKMNRRIVGSEGGKGSWYQKWHARYLCREWAREHDGELPEKVQLVKVGYPIPSPVRVWRKGPYDPKTHYQKHKRHTVVHTVKCASEQMAQLSPELAERYNIPKGKQARFRSFPRKTCRAWENKLRKEAKARGEEVDKDDPRFIRCLPKDDAKTDDAKTGSPAKASTRAVGPGSRPRGVGKAPTRIPRRPEGIPRHIDEAAQPSAPSAAPTKDSPPVPAKAAPTGG